MSALDIFSNEISHTEEHNPSEVSTLTDAFLSKMDPFNLSIEYLNENVIFNGIADTYPHIRSVYNSTQQMVSCNSQTSSNSTDILTPNNATACISDEVVKNLKSNYSFF